ncbi:hypothetical protein DFH08DRAFT_1014584 [Mycena albidolilacea]|uniref:Uncharacterized protein n=1 Tax=Mycena albidolilacea TaxID=1033008 RepID=A0AAD6ZTW6_9AGAR|nr:hypothetical protein DFH08DRAFT_1014584 [Mycena albidolilacea]
MTNINQPAPGTDSSVPAAVNDPQNIAAVQALWSAMLTLQGQAPIPAPPSVGSTSVSPAPSSASAPAAPTLPVPWLAGTIYHVVPSTPLSLTIDGENEREGPWYTITRGLHVGVTISNPIALGAVSGVSRSAMSKHKTQAQAVAAFNEALSFGLVAVLHP